MLHPNRTACGGGVPPNTLDDPLYPAVPDPPTLQTYLPILPNDPADISNPKKYPSIELSDHIMFILEPPFTNSITAMHVLHDTTDTILNSRAI